MSEITVGEGHLHRKRDRAEYAVYVALVFPFCLIGAALGRVLPGRTVYRGVNERRRSVFAEAGAHACSIIPWVFGGR